MITSRIAGTLARPQRRSRFERRYLFPPAPPGDGTWAQPSTNRKGEKQNDKV
jgi:hypothetical protein